MTVVFTNVDVNQEAHQFKFFISSNNSGLSGNLKAFLELFLLQRELKQIRLNA